MNIPCIAQLARISNTLTGSEWEIYGKHYTRYFTFDSIMGLSQVYKKKNNLKLKYCESKVNENVFEKRELVLENIVSGEVLYAQALENGKINKVTIDLSVILKKYPDKNFLNQQYFIVKEIADNQVEKFIPNFRFEL